MDVLAALEPEHVRPLMRLKTKQKMLKRTGACLEPRNAVSRNMPSMQLPKPLLLQLDPGGILSRRQAQVRDSRGREQLRGGSTCTCTFRMARGGGVGQPAGEPAITDIRVWMQAGQVEEAPGREGARGGGGRNVMVVVVVIGLMPRARATGKSHACSRDSRRRDPGIGLRLGRGKRRH